MPLTDAFFVIIIVLGATSVIGARIFTRHRERMSMIEKGMKAEDLKAFFEREAHPWSPLTSLKWGILLGSVGVAILIAMWLHYTYGAPGGVIPALIALFGGLALILFYLIARRREGL